jgi:uncharacterized membrane protein YecN with MAPEG domain
LALTCIYDRYEFFYDEVLPILKLSHYWGLLKRLVANRKNNFECTFQLITVDHTKIT